MVSVAGETGIEPATSRFGGVRSARLSYSPIRRHKFYSYFRVLTIRSLVVAGDAGSVVRSRAFGQKEQDRQHAEDVADQQPDEHLLIHLPLRTKLQPMLPICEFYHMWSELSSTES